MADARAHLGDLRTVSSRCECFVRFIQRAYTDVEIAHADGLWQAYMRLHSGS